MYHGLMERRRGSRRYAYTGFAVLCLIWLVVRSGRKPWRLRYPCQQAAAVNAAWLLPAAGLWLTRFVRSKRIQFLLSAPLVLCLLGLLTVGLQGDYPAGAAPVDLSAARVKAASLSPAFWRGSGADGNHDVFVVNHVPPAEPGNPRHAGVDSLLRLLSEGGINLYKSSADASCAAPDGLIAANDVVLLKVNSAWDQRGMTNTDVVRGLISALLAHPDGFSGEVVVVDNCEGGIDFTQQYNNAEDVNQSFQAVVDSYGDPARVSTSSWWSFTDQRVTDFYTGDYRAGYVWLGNNVSYPKFGTPRGTCVSLRNGVWDGSSYDKSRLKLINVPVLKSHSTAGVTGCMKNFMGVPSIHWTEDQHGDLLYGGFMGRVMNETVYPCLNVLDAIWVSPSHPRGPEGPYSLAVRTDTLLAGTDPVAVDYYAGKYILFPVSGYGRHDPDTPYSDNGNPYHDGSQNTGYPYNAFRVMMDTTTAALQQGGHDVTSDPARMAIHLKDLRDGLGWTGGHCLGGVTDPSTTWYFAEGTTRAGFDEWLCMENPGGSAARAELAFTTGTGERVSHEVDLPAHSRSTVHVNHIVGDGKDVSCSIRSNIPIVAERPMYFDYQGAWTGGHTIVGATAPAKKWYFAEGYTGQGFDEYICVLNPGDSPARLTFRFQTQETGEVIREGMSVPAHTRATFKVNDLLGPGYQCSLKLVSDAPVVAERPMYFDYLGSGDAHWNGGHCVLGATDPQKQFYFAEGTTRDGFQEWLTIQNPGASPIQVSATYQLGEGQGAAVSKTYAVDAGRRFTVRVADEVGGGKDVSVRLSSASPFLAERPIYFNYRGAGENITGGHCVVGTPRPYEECFFAEGYTGGGFDEYLCLQNPGPDASVVQVDYYTQEAGPLEAKTVTIPGGTRLTIYVNDHAGPGYRLSCHLRVLTGPPVAVERPMYFDYRI
jgi:hypothetical protein